MMKYLLSLLFTLGLGASAQAAALYDADTQATCRASGTPCVTIGGVSTLTYSHTVGSSTNKQLAVFAYVGCNSNDTAPSVTSITYNGTSLTAITSNTTNPGWKGYLYTWPTGSEPTAGAHNVVVTLSGLLSTCTANGTKSIQSWAVSAEGVDQTTTLSSSNTSTGTSTAPALTIASNQAGDLGIQSVCAGAGVTSTTETVRRTDNFTSNGCGSLGAATAGGSDISFSWVVPNDHWIMLGAAFKGIVGGGGGSPPVTGNATWTANSEVDLAGYNLRRCTGVACVPTIILSTINAPTHLYNDGTLVAGTTYGYSINAFDGTGNQSAYSSTVYVVAGSAPPTPPTIASVVPDATGAAVTWTGPPTTIRVQADPYGSTLQALANFPAGRYTYTWLAGSTQVCMYARDGSGVENTISTDFKCASLVGIAPALDTTPPVIASSGQPTGILPVGTTSTTWSRTVDETATCRSDIADQAGTDVTAYDALSQTMTMTGLTASANVSGLTDGSTHTYYMRCKDAAGNVNSTSRVVTVIVDTVTADTTAPTTVAGLSATAVGSSQASMSWTGATDAGGIAGYHVYMCSGAGCSSFTLQQTTTGTGTTASVTGLQPLTSYSFVVKARDTSNNLSVANSNTSTITTSAQIDTTPPLPMTNLRCANCTFTGSVLLAWDPGSDDSGMVTATIEQCTGSGCTNFAVSGNAAGIVGQSLFRFLQPSTTYRFRGLFVDGSGNVAVAYSNILEITTAATGLTQPRTSADPRESSTVTRETRQ